MRGMLPSFESQKTVTEKTTKGEAQAYSPLETPFCSLQHHYNRRGDYQSPVHMICAARTTRTAAQDASLKQKF